MPHDNMRNPLDALSDRLGVYDPRMTVCDPKTTPGHQTTPEEVIEEVNRIFAEVEGNRDTV